MYPNIFTKYFLFANFIFLLFITDYVSTQGYWHCQEEMIGNKGMFLQSP